MDYSLAKSPLMQLLQNGRRHKLPKGQILQFSYDQLLLSVVKTGYIKRYSITDDGSESIQSIYGPENIFPLTPVYKTIFNKDIYHGQEAFHYEALTPASIFSIDQSTLEEALNENPIIYKDLLFVAGVRLGSNIQNLENMSLGTAQGRVAHLLVYFADVFGQKSSEGITIELPLTHQTLANALNLARETVTHSLIHLQEKELIVSGKNIVVPDLDKLRTEAR